MNYALMDFLEHLLCCNLHITITSAKRTIAQNEAAGGAPNSQHLIGGAIDFKPGQLTTIDNRIYRVTKCSASFSCLQCDFYMCNGSHYPYQPYCLICPILLPFVS